MIKAILGITQEPFNRNELPLLEQQQRIVDVISIHAQHGGFCVVIGAPGVGKSVLREHIEKIGERSDAVVVSISRTLHTYLNILKQLAESLLLEAPGNQLEKQLIQLAYSHVQERKTLYTVIDEAHLLDMTILRKLRLLFDRFPKRHCLVLLGQPELLYHLSLLTNEDIKSRITFSSTLLPLNDQDLQAYIQRELDAVRLGANTFDDAAVELILRSAQGNLRLCRNLCYGSLIESCRTSKRVVTIQAVNEVLIQPHWRSHDQLIKQQIK
jgi:type II secretory pathway predicted ATPase ExeA